MVSYFFLIYEMIFKEDTNMKEIMYGDETVKVLEA